MTEESAKNTKAPPVCLRTLTGGADELAIDLLLHRYQ